MKDSMVADLMAHHRKKVLQDIQDITDTCHRIEDDNEAAQAASAYIVIRVALMTAVTVALKHGANKQDFLEIVAGFWDQIFEEARKGKWKSGHAG
jgi:hypothetical protein